MASKQVPFQEAIHFDLGSPSSRTIAEPSHPLAAVRQFSLGASFPLKSGNSLKINVFQRRSRCRMALPANWDEPLEQGASEIFVVHPGIFSAASLRKVIS